MRILSGRPAENFVRKLERRGATDLARVEKQVRRIVDDVRKNGDPALRRYAEKFDSLKPRQQLLISGSELARAWDSTSEEFKHALKSAATNIRRYCEWQKPHEW